MLGSPLHAVAYRTVVIVSSAEWYCFHFPPLHVNMKPSKLYEVAPELLLASISGVLGETRLITSDDYIPV
uniref:Putative secreted peptide n=1 Tax=Anopheles braziliensis TaxID=58242 RepID=A0A2M3ZXR0_9DIPT